MSNARQLRLKIDALKQEHANLPASVGWQDTTRLKANFTAFVQVIEDIVTMALDVDLCEDPQFIMSIPYPPSRPPIEPGYQQLDMGLYFQEGAGGIKGALQGALAEVTAAIAKVVTADFATTFMRVFNPYAGTYYLHWLDGSGAAMSVPVHAMLSDISPFQGKVQTDFTNMVSKVKILVLG